MSKNILATLQQCLIEADHGKRVVLSTAAGEFLIEKLPNREKLQGRSIWEIRLDQFVSPTPDTSPGTKDALDKVTIRK